MTAPQDNTPNYIKIILAALEIGTFTPSPDGVSHVHIYHDQDCLIYKGGVCDCDPEVIHEVKGRKADQ